MKAVLWIFAFILATLALLGYCSATTALRVDWGASTDPGGTGVFKYNVYRLTGSCGVPSVFIGSTTTNTYFDTTTAASTTYCYSVSAVDENGNESAKTVVGSKTSLAYATVNAASISQADVQAAVNAANDGDLVIVPTGTATWASNVVFHDPTSNPPGKGVTVQCANPAVGCNITAQAGGSGQLFLLLDASDFFYRVSGFNLTSTTVAGVLIWLVNNDNNINLTNFRVDHNTVTQAQEGFLVTCGTQLSHSSCYGVIDHNTVNSAGSSAIYRQIGATHFTPQPPPQGTANNIFSEDNTLNITTLNDGSIACQDGWGDGDQVVRHTTFVNCLGAVHGSAHEGGPQNVEVYSSSFTINNSTVGFTDCTRCFHHQGSGQILYFNNSLTHSTSPIASNALAVIHYQDYDFASGEGAFICDGTMPNGSAIATNAATAAGSNTLTFASTAVPSNWGNWLAVGWFVADLTTPSAIPAGTRVVTSNPCTPTPCTEPVVMTNNAAGPGVGNGDSIIFSPSDGNNDGNRTPLATYRGYPCWHQPGRTWSGPLGGTLSPMYAWNNIDTNNGNAKVDLFFEDNGPMPNFDYAPQHVQANRDYFNAVSASANSTPSSPFNGTTGMGFGTLANRPTTCSIANTDTADAGFGGVGYFATDKGPQGTLYRCASTNNWVIHYQPYSQFSDGVSPNCTGAAGACRHPMTAIP